VLVIGLTIRLNTLSRFARAAVPYLRGCSKSIPYNWLWATASAGYLGLLACRRGEPSVLATEPCTQNDDSRATLFPVELEWHFSHRST
jgi:hypothetical protein